MTTVNLTVFFPWALINHLIRALITFNIAHTFLKNRYNSLVTVISLLGTTTIYSYLSIIVINNFTERYVEIILGILYYIMITGTLCAVCKGGIFAKGFASLCSFMVYDISAYAFFGLGSFLTDYITFDMAYKYEISLFVYIAFNTSAYLFSFVFVIIINAIKAKIGKFHYEWRYMYMFFFPITHIVYTFLFGYTSSKTQEASISSDSDYMIGLMSFIIVVLDFMIIPIIDKQQGLDNDNTALKINLQKQESEYNNIRQIKQDNENLRKIRHDIINQNMTVAMLIENGDIEEAKKMLSANTNQAEKIIPRNFCSNKTLNAVIQLESRKCKEKGIEFHCNAVAGEEISFDKSDLCSLFTNIIDNAIEAAENADDKSISLICRPVNSTFFISVENPYEKDLSKGKNIFSTTTKKDKANHGLGHKIINQIVEKYDGHIEFEQLNNKIKINIFIVPPPRIFSSKI